MNWSEGAETFSTPIFDQVMADEVSDHPCEVVLIFADGDRVAWPTHDAHARPFVMLARTLLGDWAGNDWALNSERGTSEGHIRRSGSEPAW